MAAHNWVGFKYQLQQDAFLRHFNRIEHAVKRNAVIILDDGLQASDQKRTDTHQYPTRRHSADDGN
jgi:hypothetical protein